MGYKTTYDTFDIWQAAYLHLFGVELLDCVVQSNGRASWIFSNADDRAYQLGIEFRTAATAATPIQDFRQSYRAMAYAADRARGGNYGQGRNG